MLCKEVQIYISNQIFNVIDTVSKRASVGYSGSYTGQACQIKIFKRQISRKIQLERNVLWRNKN